jgi:hypothetical protein
MLSQRSKVSCFSDSRIRLRSDARVLPATGSRNG